MSGVLNLHESWTLEVTTDELRIIGRALRGELRAEEMVFAMELANRISTRRARLTKEKMEHADRLLANVERNDGLQ